MMLPSVLQLCRVSDNCQQAGAQVQDLFSNAKQLTDKKVTHISTAPIISYLAFPYSKISLHITDTYLYSKRQLTSCIISLQYQIIKVNIDTFCTDLFNNREPNILKQWKPKLCCTPQIHKSQPQIKLLLTILIFSLHKDTEFGLCTLHRSYQASLAAIHFY
jgi:hypothetical protein